MTISNRNKKLMRNAFQLKHKMKGNESIIFDEVNINEYIFFG